MTSRQAILDIISTAILALELSDLTEDEVRSVACLSIRLKNILLDHDLPKDELSILGYK